MILSWQWARHVGEDARCQEEEERCCTQQGVQQECSGSAAKTDWTRKVMYDNSAAGGPPLQPKSEGCGKHHSFPDTCGPSGGVVGTLVKLRDLW
jgi:hypothetical protein